MKIIVASVLSAMLVSFAVVIAMDGRSAPPRYQIVYSPRNASDTFMIDTQDGRVWVEAVTDKGQPASFQSIPVNTAP